MGLRLARPEDCAALLAIYEQYIQTPITFEYELPSREEFTRRITSISAEYPYLVWEEGEKILGYAYAHRLAERTAYQWSAELSIYVDRSAVGKGLGRKLYGALVELLKLQGVRTAYALVCTPNPASEGLHRAMGFRTLAVHPNTGYKNGAWRDLTWFEKAIGDYEVQPEFLRPIAQISTEDIQAVLAPFS